MERELEVKVLDMDFEQVEQKIISLGGVLIGKEKQINTLIDSREKPIKSYLDAYLRIRETKDLIGNKNSIEITLKKNVSRNGLRDNIELTTEIENKEIMLNILQDLGFHQVDVGYKDRKSYKFLNGRIDFDIWDENTYPFPYMEIEVEDSEHLERIVEALEIPKENISTKSIIRLKKELENHS